MKMAECRRREGMAEEQKLFKVNRFLNSMSSTFCRIRPISDPTLWEVTLLELHMKTLFFILLANGLLLTPVSAIAKVWTAQGCQKDYSGVPAFKQLKEETDAAYLQLNDAVSLNETTHKKCASMSAESDYNNSDSLKEFTSASDLSSKASIAARQSVARALKSLDSFEGAISAIGVTKGCKTELANVRQTLGHLDSKLQKQVETLKLCTNGSGAPGAGSEAGKPLSKKRGTVEYQHGRTPKKGPTQYQDGRTPRKGSIQYSY